MSGFIYNGKSTSDIIGRLLILCGLEAVDSVIGIQRESQVGEVTITRPIPNEYGMINNKLQFSYCLMVSPCETDTAPWITNEELVIIEKWLTSPKYSTDLYIINDNDEILCTYCGKFIETTWYLSGDGYSMVSFTFENNSAYAKDSYSYSFSNEEAGDWNFTIDCDSDEENEYVYPTIIITNPNETTDITIINNNDYGEINRFTITALGETDTVIDSKNCLLLKKPIGSSITYDSQLSFEDAGWSDVGNIYWLRLIPGENVITVGSPCEITFNYDVIRKKVGGWLYD